MNERDELERQDDYAQERRNAELILNELMRMIELLQGVAADNLIAGLERARDEALLALSRMSARSTH